MFNIAFDVDIIRAVDEFCKDNNVEMAAALAVISVESNGITYGFDGNGDKRPIIRWEGHYFYRRLKGDELTLAVQQGLASPKVGGIKNPKTQAGRWELFWRAYAINANAAIESMSYGVGQVMGANWKSLGYGSAGDFFQRVGVGITGQLDAMFRFIVKNGLLDELQRKDWAGFARGYNGAGYRKNNYDTNMRKAYEQLAGSTATSSPANGLLRMGSKGARVRDLQALLTRAGFPVKVDGDFGPTTKTAVQKFQRKHQLEDDGVVGPQTQRSLEKFRQAPDEKIGAIAATDVKEVRDAAKGVGLLAMVMQFRDTLADGAAQLTGLEIETAQTLANYALAGSAVIGTGLALYGIYGWWQSRKTDTGDA